MLKPRTLVTGATGKTGSVVVAELLKAGYPVRAMVHREDGRSVQPTIARRYAALPRNRRTPGSWLRHFGQFVIAPLSPGSNFDRYDRELRRPTPSEPQFASESKIRRREHGDAKRNASIAEIRTLRA